MPRMSRGHPLALTGFLPAWDIERRRVDTASLADWVLRQLRERVPTVDSLHSLHHHLDPAQALACSRALTAASLAPEPRRLLHCLVRQVVPEIAPERVSVQTYLHVRILVPADTVSPFPPHTDFGLGHSLDERNLWVALTDAAGDAALRVLPLAESLTWTARTGHLHGLPVEPPALPPVPVERGEVLLFTPLHLHAARAPAAGTCRVSVDVRLRPRQAFVRDLTFLPLSSSD